MKRIAIIEDFTGEKLHCEFSAHHYPNLLTGTWTGNLPPAEITLRKVTFPAKDDGQFNMGVETVGGHDHRRFVTIMRPDEDHLEWDEIEHRCQQAYDAGETTSAIQPVSDRSEEG